MGSTRNRQLDSPTQVAEIQSMDLSRDDVLERLEELGHTDSRPWVRLEACRALARAGERALEALDELAFETPDSNLAREAWSSIARMGSEHLALLERRLMSSSREGISAEPLLEAFAVYGETGLAPVLAFLESVPTIQERGRLMGALLRFDAAGANVLRTLAVEGETSIRAEACASLAKQGANHQAFFHRIMREDPSVDVRMVACESLARCGRDAIEPLLETGCGDGPEVLRCCAIDKLGKHPLPEGEDHDLKRSLGARLWTLALNDPSPQIRRYAALALRNLDMVDTATTAPEGVSALYVEVCAPYRRDWHPMGEPLRKWLLDGAAPDTLDGLVTLALELGHIARLARSVLGKLGSRARRAVLTEALATQDETRLCGLLILLLDLPPGEDDGEDVLRRLIRIARKSEHPATANLVCRLLFRFGHANSADLLDLAKSRATDWLEREDCWALETLGVESLPLLIELAVGGSSQGRDVAAKGITELAPAAIDLLVAEALDTDCHFSRRYKALDLLAKQGPQVAPILARMVQDGPDRQQAVRALARLEGEGSALAAELALAHPEPAIRRAAVRGLAEQCTVSELVQLAFDHEDSGTRLAALGAIADLAEGGVADEGDIWSPTSVARLGKVVRKSAHEGMREAAFRALVSIGAPAIPVLRDLALLHEESSFRRRAIEAIGRHPSRRDWSAVASDRSLEALLDITTNGRGEVRQLAIDTLVLEGQPVVTRLARSGAQKPAAPVIFEILARIGQPGADALDELLTNNEDPRAIEAAQLGRDWLKWRPFQRFLEEAAQSRGEVDSAVRELHGVRVLDDPRGVGRRLDCMQRLWSAGPAAQRHGDRLLSFLLVALRQYRPRGEAYRLLFQKAISVTEHELIEDVGWLATTPGPVALRSFAVACIGMAGVSNPEVAEQATAVLRDARAGLEQLAGLVDTALTMIGATEEPSGPAQDLDVAYQALRHRVLDGDLDGATQALVEHGGSIPGRGLTRRQWRRVAEAVREKSRGEELLSQVWHAKRSRHLDWIVSRLERPRSRSGGHGRSGAQRRDLEERLEELETFEESFELEWEEERYEQMERAWPEAPFELAVQIFPDAEAEPSPVSASTAPKGSTQSLARPEPPWRGQLDAPRSSAMLDLFDENEAEKPRSRHDRRALLSYALQQMQLGRKNKKRVIRAARQLAQELGHLGRYHRALLREALPTLHPDWRDHARILLVTDRADRSLFAACKAAHSSALARRMASDPVSQPFTGAQVQGVERVQHGGGGTLRRLDYPPFELVARPMVSLLTPELEDELWALAWVFDELSDHLSRSDSLPEMLGALIGGAGVTVEDMSSREGELWVESLERHVVAYAVLRNDVFPADVVRIRDKHIRKFWTRSAENSADHPSTCAEVRARWSRETLAEGLAHALIRRARLAHGARREPWIHALRTLALLYAAEPAPIPTDHNARSVASFLNQRLRHSPLELQQALGLPPEQRLPSLRGGAHTPLERRMQKALRAARQPEARSDAEAATSTYRFRPLEKVEAFARGELGHDCSSGAVPFRAMSPHHVYYGILDHQDRTLGYMTVFEAWAVLPDETRAPVLVLETVNTPDRSVDAVLQDLLMLLERLAYSRGLYGLVVVTEIGTWNYVSEELVSNCRRARDGVPVRLEPADPAVWRAYELLVPREATYYCAFNAGRRQGRTFQLLAPFEAEKDRISEENLVEADRIVSLRSPGLLVTLGDMDNPLGFISGELVSD